MGVLYDDETEILTHWTFHIKGVRVESNNSWCPGAIVSFYEWSRDTIDGGTVSNWTPRDQPYITSDLPYTTIDCPKVLYWTPVVPKRLWNGVEIEYPEDGCMRREVLATDEEADEIALRAIYDELDMAQIAVTRTLSVGTSIVWLEVERMRGYSVPIPCNVRLVVEFGNSEECTRFLQEDMRKLENQRIDDMDADVPVIGDIMRTVVPIIDKHFPEHMLSAAERAIPFSQFIDEYPQRETQLVRHRGPNRRHARPCYLPLHLSIPYDKFVVDIDCGSTIPANFPSCSSPFRSLNNIHFNFPSSAPHNCPDHDRTSHNDTDPLSFTVEATGIHSLSATTSVAQRNSITIKSGHRNVHVDLAGLHSVSFNINIISGDSYFGAIHGGNIGGRNNVNTFRISSPVGSRSPRSAWSLPRRHTPLLQEQAESQGGVGRWVQQRSPRPRPY